MRTNLQNLSFSAHYKSYERTYKSFCLYLEFIGYTDKKDKTKCTLDHLYTKINGNGTPREINTLISVTMKE